MKNNTYPFSAIAHNITERIDPAKAKTDIYVGLEHLDPESIHLSKWGHPSDVTGDKFVFKKGDVIFGRRRAYQRKLAIADCDGICSAHAMVLGAKPDVILPEFLPFFLSSDMFMERAIGISVGSLSPTINWTTLKNETFPLPPLSEQKRLAEILWAADEVVEKWKRVLSDLDNAYESTIRNVFLSNREIEKHGNPISYIADMNPRTETQSERDKTIVSFITMEGVSEKWFIKIEESKLLKDVYKGYTPFRRGDILFAKITPCMENGKGAWLQTLQHEIGYGSTEFFVLRPKDKKDAPFIFHLTNSATFRKIATGWMQGSAGQLRVSIDLFTSEKFMLPDLKTRVEIGCRLHDLWQRKIDVDNHIEYMLLLLKGIIRDAIGECDVL